MHISKLTVSGGITVNMGNYQSFRADLSAEATLDPDDDVREVHQKLTESVKKRLVVQAKRMDEEVFGYLEGRKR